VVIEKAPRRWIKSTMAEFKVIWGWAMERDEGSGARLEKSDVRRTLGGVGGISRSAREAVKKKKHQGVPGKGVTGLRTYKIAYVDSGIGFVDF